MQNLTETNPNPCKIHTLSIRNPTKSSQNPSETQQNHGESIRYISDTYHDPSQRVPKIYYWNAEPPQKKKKGGIYYCAANIMINPSQLPKST